MITVEQNKSGPVYACVYLAASDAGSVDLPVSLVPTARRSFRASEERRPLCSVARLPSATDADRSARRLPLLDCLQRYDVCPVY